MIKESDRYYGCVFAHLIASSGADVTLGRLSRLGGGHYLYAGRIPLIIKYSTSRKGPWMFTFQTDHLEKFCQVKQEFGNCVIALVCGMDGIVALDAVQFEGIAMPSLKRVVTVSVKRRLRQMYAVSGTHGILKGRVSKTALTEILLNGSNA